MFFRYNRLNCRIPADLDDLYNGSVILAGGSPVLKEEKNLHLLNEPGVMVMSMNNTASIVPSDLWIGADKPRCYSHRILRDPKIMKFAMISRRNILAADYIDWKFMPHTYFFGTSDKFNIDNFLSYDRNFVWWKNIFYISIQILYRLGFRKIYLIGCQFKIEKDSQYAYGAKLDDEAVVWNKKTYNTVVKNMKKLKPTFERKNLEIVSCTPGSPLNDIYPTCTPEDAVKEILTDYPQSYDIDKCVHSSFFSKKGDKNG